MLNEFTAWVSATLGSQEGPALSRSISQRFLAGGQIQAIRVAIAAIDKCDFVVVEPDHRPVPAGILFGIFHEDPVAATVAVDDVKRALFGRTLRGGQTKVDHPLAVRTDLGALLMPSFFLGRELPQAGAVQVDRPDRPVMVRIAAAFPNQEAVAELGQLFLIRGPICGLIHVRRAMPGRHARPGAEIAQPKSEKDYQTSTMDAHATGSSDQVGGCRREIFARGRSRQEGGRPAWHVPAATAGLRIDRLDYAPFPGAVQLGTGWKIASVAGDWPGAHTRRRRPGPVGIRSQKSHHEGRLTKCPTPCNN